MTERLGSGLQNRAHGFESRYRLHFKGKNASISPNLVSTIYLGAFCFSGSDCSCFNNLINRYSIGYNFVDYTFIR